MTKKIQLSGNKPEISLYSSAAALIGALISHQVYAQQAEPSTQAKPEVEEVVVYGIKQSLKNAQDLKRDSATVIDAITASDITSLPDRSVVDALTRVPGVTVEVFEATEDPEHFGAEGSSALIRGLDRTLTQFNGRSSFSATQWGAVDLSHIPSELVGAIEVQKNQTASMIEGGIAGTINVVTRKAFDSPGMQFGGSIKEDYGDLVEKWSPSLSGLFSNRWDTGIGEVGFLGSLAWSKTNSASQAVGTHNFYEKSTRTTARYPEGNSVEGIGDPLPGADPDDVYWMPPSVQIRDKADKNERLGWVSSLQWRNPAENFLATLEFIHSDNKSTWTERMIQNKDQLGDQVVNRNVVSLLEIPGISGLNESFDENGVFTHGVFAGDRADDYGYAPETRYHDERTYVNDISLDIQWNVSDNLTINSDIQFVDSGLTMFDHTIHSFFRSDVYLDLRSKDNPKVGFLGDNFHLLTPTELATGSGPLMQDANGAYWGGDTSSITDPQNIHTRSAMDHNTDSSGKDFTFSLDADYELDNSWLTNIKVGVRVSDRTQTHKSTEYDWGIISPEWSDQHRRSLADYPQFQEVYEFGRDFHNGDAFVDGSVTAFYVPKLEWVKDLNRFEQTFRSIVPKEYDPAIAALPISDDIPADDPRRDSTWYWTAEEGAQDPFFTLESRVVGGKTHGSPYSPYYIFEVQERKNAAYVQLDFSFTDLPTPIRGNIGFRYVDIDVTTAGARNFRTPEESGEWANPARYTSNTQIIGFPEDLERYLRDNAAAYEEALANNQTAPVPDASTLDWLNGYSERIGVRPKKYSTVLPSLNLTMNLQEDLLLRFAASKAIYLPHLSLKRASQELGIQVDPTNVPEGSYPSGWDEDRGQPLAEVRFLNYTSGTVGGSNPHLVPEESINVDLGIEWYFSDVGSLSGVLFHKDMDNLIRRGTTRLDTVNPATGVVETVVQGDTYGNVGKAKIKGFEISYQQTYDMLPGFWSGLGLQANYTRLYTSEDTAATIDTTVYGSFSNLPLEGLSPTSYNVIVFYENDTISTRLAYNFRSQYMLNARDVIGKRPVYNTDRGVLDYSFTYKLSDNFRVGFDINNLTNETTHTMYQYDVAGNLHPRNYFINDRRFTLRASANF